MDKYKQLLPGYIKNKSISTDVAFKDGILGTVEWLRTQFTEGGFDVTVVEGYDNPIVVASYVADPSYKTCLIYGHYDVQPADLSEGWDSDPFVATERNGRFYCRGAIDNKGQNLVHVVSIIDLIKAGKLGYNVKFMIEGNEETGSPNLEQFLKDKKDLLQADFVMISDGELTANLPTIELGFRGGFNLTLTVTTSSTDLHSGMFGGAAPSSAHELAKLIAGLYDKDNQITIPGFYEGVDEITDEIRANNERIPFSEEEYQKLSGAKGRLGEPGYDFYTQTALRPTIQVTGIKSGYTGDGYRNSIPASSTAKINFRLVLHQDPNAVIKLFTDYVKKAVPDYVDVVVEPSDPYDGIKLSPDSEYIKKAYQTLEEVYGRQPLYKYVGGGIPVVTYFNDLMGIPTVSVPLANEDCYMHAANENFTLDCLEKGLAFSQKFFQA